MAPVRLHCPECKADVECTNGNKDCICGTCKKNFKSKDGIIKLTKSNTYWNLITERSMKQLNELSKKKNWEYAIKSLCPQFWTIAREDGRCDWKYLLPLDYSSTVLDFGSGLGAASISIAREGARVISMDKTEESLKFIKTRSRQEGLESNIIPFLYEGSGLPFEDDTFEIIILNGVLEWLVTSHTYATSHYVIKKHSGQEARSETDIQLDFLKECRRVIKPTGILYIGIENRISLKYFLGFKEEHTKLWGGINFIPRNLSHKVCRLIKGSKHLAKTYTKQGYKKTLRKAGFNDVKFYMPVPDYRMFGALTSLEDRNVLNHFFRDSPPDVTYWFYIYKCLNMFGLLPIFSNSYSIYSSPESLNFGKIFANVYKELNLPKKESSYYLAGKSLLRGFISVVIFVNGKDVAPVYIKTHRDKADKKEIEKELENLARARKLINPLYKDTIVSAKKVELSEDRTAIVQKAFSGYNLAQYFETKNRRKKNNLANKWVPVLTSWLTDFHRNSCNLWSSSEDKFRNILKQRLSFAELLDRKMGTKMAENLKLDIKKISNDFQIPIGMVHGDFAIVNVLFDKKDRYIVVDWEDANAQDCGIDDLCNLIFSFGNRLSWNKYGKITQKVKKKLFKSSGNSEIYYHDFFSEKVFMDIIDHGITSYCKRLGLDNRVVKLWFPFYLIKYACLELEPQRDSIVKCKNWIKLLGDFRKSAWSLM